MFYWLAEFSDGGGVFNLFRYITVRLQLTSLG